MGTRNIPLDAAGPTVEDVMLREPRTVAPETTVAEARTALENPRVRLLLVARGATFVGAITRDRLGEDVAGEELLGALAARDAAPVGPADSVARAIELLDARQTDRLPVVADDGALVGLVCFNRKHGHFCVNA